MGAVFDYLLNEKGEMPVQRRMAFKGEIGILGLGMNTVELLVVRNGSPVQRFTAGRKLGVRRLLELINQDRAYSLAELDARLGGGCLDIARALLGVVRLRVELRLALRTMWSLPALWHGLAL